MHPHSGGVEPGGVRKSPGGPGFAETEMSTLNFAGQGEKSVMFRALYAAVCFVGTLKAKGCSTVSIEVSPQTGHRVGGRKGHL